MTETPSVAALSLAAAAALQGRPTRALARMGRLGEEAQVVLERWRQLDRVGRAHAIADATARVRAPLPAGIRRNHPLRIEGLPGGTTPRAVWEQRLRTAMLLPLPDPGPELAEPVHLVSWADAAERPLANLGVLALAAGLGGVGSVALVRLAATMPPHLGGRLLAAEQWLQVDPQRRPQLASARWLLACAEPMRRQPNDEGAAQTGLRMVWPLLRACGRDAPQQLMQRLPPSWPTPTEPAPDPRPSWRVMAEWIADNAQARSVDAGRGE